MTIQAQFSDIKWESSDNRIMTISSLSYSFGIKTESKKGSDGNDKVVAKGYKKDSLTVQYTAARNCGVNPEQEHAKACRIAESGIKAPFILGEKRFGPLKTMLMKVKPSNVKYGNDGTMLSIDLTLSFGEPEEEKEKKTSQKKKSIKKKNSVSNKSTLMDKMKKEKGIK